MTRPMARKRQELAANKATGNFERLIGWKWNSQGHKYIQHKFYLGKDLAKAQLANRRLEELWEHIEKDFRPGPPPWDRPLWYDVALMIGKAISKGQMQVTIAPRSTDNPPAYACYLHQIAAAFPMVSIVPADPKLYQDGADLETQCVENQIAKIKNQAALFGRLPVGSPILGASDVMLHAAFDAHIEHIHKSVLTPAVEGETQVTSLYGYTQVRNVERLKERHSDMPLSQVGHNTIQAMIDVWRARPSVKGTTRPIAVKTATEHIKQLKRFFKWLHRNDNFDWRKPEDFDSFECSVKSSAGERAAKLNPLQVATFTVDELCLLYKYATPFERTLLLLGMNCGFGAAEISTLLMGEVCLHKPHQYADALGFQSTKDDSFIKRLRPKTDVYGEWLLWPETVQAMQWAIQRRRNQTTITGGPDKGKPIPAKPDSVLLLGDKGTPLVKQTKKGNRSSRIANLWELGLCARIKKDHPSFHSLSFGKLRKTAGNLVKQVASGEVAAVFLCHGQPVKSDDLLDVYTNRPFAKVFEANRKVRESLAAVFEYKTDWPVKRKRGGPNLTVEQSEQIVRLLSEGLSVEAIAEAVGVSRMAVYRRRAKVEESPPRDGSSTAAPNN